MSHIFRRRYVQSTLKRTQNFEKVDYCLRETELNLEFLLQCRGSNVVPIFLVFALVVM